MATALHSPDAAYACPACGNAVAELGEICRGCGATLELERCIVEVWRGYTTATFIARTADELVAESPSFRCRGRQSPAETPAAQAALAGLTTDVLASAWSAAPDDGGPAWFELAFERLAATSPVEAHEQEDEPAEPVDVPPAPRELVRALPTPLPSFVEEAPPARVATPRPTVAKPERARGSRLVTLVSIAGIAVAGVLGYAIAHRSPSVTTRIVTVTQPAAAAHAAVRRPAAAPVAAKPATPGVSPVRVNLTAKQDTWLELRRGSKTGAVIFSGILPSGQHLSASGKHVWARFAAAGNVDVTVDGKPVELVGTLERVFGAPSR